MDKRLIASLGGVAAALAMAGCTSLIPRYERPAAPVPAAFAGDATAVSATSWGVAFALAAAFPLIGAWLLRSL